MSDVEKMALVLEQVVRERDEIRREAESLQRALTIAVEALRKIAEIITANRQD